MAAASMDWDSDYIRNFVASSLEQDRGASDFAATVLFPAPAKVRARIIADADLICAGLPLIERIFRKADARVQISSHSQDGQEVRRDVPVMELRGVASAILRAERTALDLLEHLCGIATNTRRFTQEIAGARTRICGPREATPRMRLLEQYAIQVGGGIAHPANAILLTTNHVKLAGGIKPALDQAHSQLALQLRPQAMTAYEAAGGPRDLPDTSATIQIEVQNERELHEALGAGAEFVILKNVGLQEARHFVQIARGFRPDVIVELAAEITLANIRAYAETGADRLCCPDSTLPAPRASFHLLVERLAEK